MAGTQSIRLDIKDKKLLFELDFNARASYADLAKKIRMSKQGVEYKLNNLIKKGVIKGFYPIINMPKLGYLYCRLSITLQNTTKEKLNEIVQYLKNHPKVFWLFKMQGTYDLWIAIWAKSVTEFKEFVGEIETTFGEHIKRSTEAIATDVIHLQHRYLLGTKQTKELHIKETEERVTIDDIDKDILAALCADARMLLVDIAKRVGESAKVVAYRIRKLEEKKIIEGYRPVINNNLIGYTYYKAFINLNKTSKEKISQLKEYIAQHPLVIYIVEGVGIPADLDIELMVKSNQELFSFIEDLRFAFPALIGEYQTVIFMDTLKVRYLPF